MSKKGKKIKKAAKSEQPFSSEVRKASRKLNNLTELLAILKQKEKTKTVSTEAFKESNYSLPATLGVTEAYRKELDKEFSKTVGMDSVVGSLTQHAIDMGQFPVTAFVGYGALQQIAQNGMIRNCIKTVADDITREWIKVTGGDDTPTEKIDKLQEAQETQFRLQSLFNDAICKVGFMGGAFIFIRTEPKDEPDVDLTLPLIVNGESGELGEASKVSFVVVDPINVSPGPYNSYDPLRSDYMKPGSWMVLGHQVHASRLITLYANEPPTLLKPAYNFLGIPQAQILWDYVNHWNECRVSAQDLIKKLSLLIYYTDMQSRMGSYGGIQELDAIMEVLQHYRNNDSVFVADKESDQVDNVQTTVSGVQDIVRQAQEMIAAINRTPAVKLFGISPSGFNATGESDIRNYNDHVRSQQELYRPAIQKCLEVIQVQLFGEVDPSISFEFNELNLDNESAQAMNFNARVTALSTLKDRNVISAEELRQAVRMDENSRLSFLSDELPEPEEGDLFSDDESRELFDQYKGSIFGESENQPAMKKQESIFDDEGKP